ncbi:MAG TPA: hypothetical protein VGM10_33860 [Actinocrinis sp.]
MTHEAATTTTAARTRRSTSSASTAPASPAAPAEPGGELPAQPRARRGRLGLRLLFGRAGRLPLGSQFGADGPCAHRCEQVRGGVDEERHPCGDLVKTAADGRSGELRGLLAGLERADGLLSALIREQGPD